MRTHLATQVATDSPAVSGVRSYPYRRTFVVVEALVAGCGLAGAWGLYTDASSPSLSAIEPLGLSSWTLPALWLIASVAVPSAAAAWLAWHRSVFAPAAVLFASTMLAVELLVQLPFVGTNVLQAVFGAIAVTLATLALRARRAGWWHR